MRPRLILLAQSALLAGCGGEGAMPDGGVADAGADAGPVAIGFSIYPFGLAVDQDRVYWTTDYPGAVLSVGKEGASQAVLIDGQDDPRTIVVKDGILYWRNSTTGRVMRMPSVGGGANILVEEAGLSALVITDGGEIFWTN